MFFFKDFSEDKYHIANYLEFTNSNYDVYSSAFLVGLKKLNAVSTPHTITSDAFRPLLSSEKIYGVNTLYWVLMFYNNIYDFNEWTLGKKIQYPSRDNIDTLISVIRS